ncbi:retrotransposon protein, putative, ty1-copia subclass [Tanacetum coccineum]
MTKNPFSGIRNRAKDLLELVHLGVCGPFRIQTRDGDPYFLTFIDDFSRYGYVYMIKLKHDVFKTLVTYQREVENQLDKKTKILRSECVGEYLSHKFLDHLVGCGIVSQRTPPYTSQHNGVSEIAPVFRISGRVFHLLERYYGYLVDSEERDLGDQAEPETYYQVMNDFESDKWLEAMNTEMQSIKDNEL